MVGGGSSGSSSIPAAPTNVVAMAGRGHINGMTGNYAIIGWDDADGASSYTLYYGATSSITTSSSHVSGVTNPYVFSNANIAAGSYYYFAVTASNEKGESALSQVKRMAVLIPKTGQTTQYTNGDDGDLEKGIAWPVGRFLDNGNQTVTDTLTGLMWQKDPTAIIGRSDWNTAFNSCNASFIGSHTDWRIPNLRELQSLIDYSLYPMPLDVAAFPYSNKGLSNTIYWTSATYKNTTTSAWYVDMYTGQPGVADKTTGSCWVWAVRDDIGAATAEVARTGQSTQYHPKDDGDITMQKGVIWPSPRFVDNTDGTVTDIQTGLMWVKDANQASVSPSIWSSAVSGVAGIATGGYHDWRLPNVRELESLLDISQDAPCLPVEYLTKFSNVQSNLYWTSTTYAGGTGSAWCIDLTSGSIQPSAKSATLYVWPVRSTQ